MMDLYLRSLADRSIFFDVNDFSAAYLPCILLYSPLLCPLDNTV